MGELKISVAKPVVSAKCNQELWRSSTLNCNRAKTNELLWYYWS